MPLIVAVWPNNTISVVRMNSGYSMVDLFDALDEEANPEDAKCYELSGHRGRLHTTFDWARSSKTGEPATRKSVGIRLGCLHGHKKKLEWPAGVGRMWLRRLGGERWRAGGESRVARMTADEIACMPAEPTKMFTVDEVRAMSSFCGVYFAYDDDGKCHYVGESEDVTCRVSRSRPEIGDRRIGVIACPPHERKRIEAYFVGVLNPPGNAASSHRMFERSRQSEVQDG